MTENSHDSDYIHPVTRIPKDEYANSPIVHIVDAVNSTSTFGRVTNLISQMTHSVERMVNHSATEETKRTAINKQAQVEIERIKAEEEKRIEGIQRLSQDRQGLINSLGATLDKATNKSNNNQELSQILDTIVKVAGQNPYY